MLAVLALVLSASAQTPVQIPGLPPGIQLTQGGGASLRWLTADVVSERFLGETVLGPKFTNGEQVELIVEENGKARVRDGDHYGWVPVASLTSTAPTPAAGSDANALLGGLPPLIPAPK
jgi:hypothetical protein